MKQNELGKEKQKLRGGLVKSCKDCNLEKAKNI